jgi:hypothetical protein
VTRSGTLREYLDDHPHSEALLEDLVREIAVLGPIEQEESRSQVAFLHRGRVVARFWAPGQYLGDHGAPAVLTLVFPERDKSPRWKAVVEPKPGVFTHHLELHTANDIDDQVRRWIARAWQNAGRPR